MAFAAELAEAHVPSRTPGAAALQADLAGWTALELLAVDRVLGMGPRSAAEGVPLRASVYTEPMMQDAYSEALGASTARSWFAECLHDPAVELARSRPAASGAVERLARRPTRGCCGGGAWPRGALRSGPPAEMRVPAFARRPRKRLLTRTPGHVHEALAEVVGD